MAPTKVPDYLSNDDKIEPPGVDRPLPEPTKSGKIDFEYAPTGLKGKTFYKLWGELSNSSKPPLICLHGGPGISHEHMLPLCLVFEDFGIPVIIYDQIGCGQSTRFPEKKGVGSFWPVDLFIAELNNLRKRLGIATFDLWGQSWGGMLAGEYAITQPQGLRKLIISNSLDCMASWITEANNQRAHLPEDVQRVLDECEARPGGIDSKEYMEATMTFYHKHSCRLTEWPGPLNTSFEGMAEDNTVYSTMMGPNEFTCDGTLQEWDIRESLKTVTAKTVPGGMLLLNGYYDAGQDWVMGAFWRNTTCRVKWVTFMLSSHLVEWEEGEKYVKTIGDFLSSE